MRTITSRKVFRAIKKSCLCSINDHVLLAKKVSKELKYSNKDRNELIKAHIWLKDSVVSAHVLRRLGLFDDNYNLVK